MNCDWIKTSFFLLFNLHNAVYLLSSPISLSLSISLGLCLSFSCWHTGFTSNLVDPQATPQATVNCGPHPRRILVNVAIAVFCVHTLTGNFIKSCQPPGPILLCPLPLTLHCSLFLFLSLSHSLLRLLVLCRHPASDIRHGHQICPQLVKWRAKWNMKAPKELTKREREIERETERGWERQLVVSSFMITLCKLRSICYSLKCCLCDFCSRDPNYGPMKVAFRNGINHDYYNLMP